MRIAILHQDLEESEQIFNDLFKKKGIRSKLYDINKTKIEDILNFKPNIAFNRVYASVANRNYNDIAKTLVLLNNLEDKNIFCLNSHLTSIYDYSKVHAANIMQEKNIFTASTEIVNKLDEKTKDKIEDFVYEHKFPLIIKRNTGGRGKDIKKVNTEDQLYFELENLLEEGKKNNYTGGFVVQEFLKSNRDYDCRIGIIEGKFAFSYARSLISDGEYDTDKWLASVSKGSNMFDYKPSEQEIQIAKDATKAVGALFNEVDLIFTEKGPGIIENNPTPNYDRTEIDKIEKAIDLIIKYKK